MPRGKRILLGVTGGIAAYKSAYLVRELRRSGTDVRVVMTEAATKFVTPVTFSALSGHEVEVDLWSMNQTTDSNIGTRHIHLANWPDLLLIAPASANTIAKLTYGLADNLLTTIVLACRRPIVLAPTMDADMYLNPATLENLTRLRERGFFVVPPEEGEHASGLEGPGRLPGVESIVRIVQTVLSQSHLDLKNKRILVTAGPTVEPIDPVRFVSNRSSGKMGFAVANAAALRGASVTLIAGPVALETPRNVQRIDVGSAEEMHKAVMRHAKKADAVIMAAAVADFTPARRSAEKMKKDADAKDMELRLKPTADILQSLGRRKNGVVLVGFALETQNAVRNAKAKLERKNLDLIALNTVDDENDPFGADTNRVTLIDRNGRTQKLQPMPKFDVANAILDRVKEFMR